MQKHYEPANINHNKLQFVVEVCPYGTSPQIQKAIWSGQHICVTDEPKNYYAENYGNDFNSEISITESNAGDAIIKHQLNVEHYSVLNMGFVKFNCYGFPHSTIAQITRHRDSAFLVSSMRYTGEKFIAVAHDELDVSEAFYVRPPGNYRDRSGRSIDWTQDDYDYEYWKCLLACKEYTKLINRGAPYEHAREFLPYCYRQPFTIAGTIESFWHWLDQRSKKDAEREIQILAKLCLDEFKLVAPELAEWYEQNRWSKARLAP